MGVEGAICVDSWLLLQSARGLNGALLLRVIEEGGEGGEGRSGVGKRTSLWILGRLKIKTVEM